MSFGFKQRNLTVRPVIPFHFLLTSPILRIAAPLWIKDPDSLTREEMEAVSGQQSPSLQCKFGRLDNFLLSSNGPNFYCRKWLVLTGTGLCASGKLSWHMGPPLMIFLFLHAARRENLLSSWLKTSWSIPYSSLLVWDHFILFQEVMFCLKLAVEERRYRSEEETAGRRRLSSRGFMLPVVFRSFISYRKHEYMTS